MKLIENLDDITGPFERAVVTIGNFDTVHTGHQALFHHVLEKADAIGGTAVAITFEPHPIRVLKKNGRPPLITMYEQKVELIAKTGIDVLICIPFTEAFARITAREFVEDILINRTGMRAMVVGKDYTFGKNREGNIRLLAFYADALDFDLTVLDWIRNPDRDPQRASSTLIRELVMAGRVSDARKMLGRYYQIRGRVEKGRDRGGKLLGFPTANITLQDDFCPKTGVYAVTVEYRGQKFPGVANIGYSPTFDDHIFTVEVHILDFDRDIYNDQVRVNFVTRIRDELKFPGIPELKEQIEQDIVTARGLLANAL